MTNNVNGNISYNMINNKTEINIVCAECGCTPKNDEWFTPRSDVLQKEKYCFDCGGEAENEFWEDYAQRKMAN